MKPNQTYRPYLTGPEVLHIIAMIDASSEPTKIGNELKKKLSVLAFKIQNDLAAPSYTFAPKTDKLGFSQEEITSAALTDSELYEFLCSLTAPTEEQIAVGRELEIKLFGQIVGGI